VIHTICIVNYVPNLLHTLSWLESHYLSVSMKISKYTKFNFKFQHLAFEVNGKHRWVVHQDSKTMMLTFVNENVFVVGES